MKIVVSFILILFAINSFSEEETYETLVERGTRLQNAGEYDRAIIVLKNALDLKPDSELAYYEIGLSYFMMDDFNLAIKYCEKSLEISDQLKAQNYIILAHSFVKRRKSRELNKLIDEVMNDTINNEILYFNFAEISFQNEEYENCRNFLEKGIKVNYLNLNLHFLLSLTNYTLDYKNDFVMNVLYFLLNEPSSKRSYYLFTLLFDELYSLEFKDAFVKTTVYYSSMNVGIYRGSYDYGIVETWYETNYFNLLEKFHEKYKGIDYYTFAIQQIDKFMVSTLKDQNNLLEPTKLLYFPYINSILNSEHRETFFKYITQNFSDSSAVWLNNNTEKIQNFSNWLQSNN